MVQKEKDSKKEKHEERGYVVSGGRGRKWGRGMEKKMYLVK
jgi:hypothetical protein